MVVRFDGLCDRSDLVDFEEQTVAGLFVHSTLYPTGVCDSQIVSDHLHDTFSKLSD